MTERVYLAPLSDEILRLAVAGLALPPHPRVLDVCCGMGPASLFLAREHGALCTGVDMDETLLLRAREGALEARLDSQIEFLRADARHLELPMASFDLILALGGALTYIGRPEGLERSRQLLKPGGTLLVSDLVYRDSPPPEAVERLLRREAPESPIAALGLEPAVRAVYEEGIYSFETEASYRSLLSTFGFDVLFTFPVPESAWNRYYDDAARSQEDPGAALRIPVAIEELASYYCWGGRWRIDYLVAGARVAGL